MIIQYKIYLKILQKLRCLVAYQNRPSAPIGRDENSVHSKFLKDNFIKKSLPLSTWRKLSILLKFPFPSVCFSGVCFTLKYETLVFFTIVIELSHFCLTFEDFCLSLTFSHGPRDPKRFGRAEKWGLGTRQGRQHNTSTSSQNVWKCC